jgi:hypothetical protein
MVTIEHNIGRLVEIRWRHPITDEDAHYLQQQVSQLQGTQTPKIVCIDARAIKVFPAKLSEIMKDIIQREVEDLVRSAILLAKNNAIGSLQHTRLLHDAPRAKQKSRLFTDEAELLAWLSEILTTAEHTKLSQFLMNA